MIQITLNSPNWWVHHGPNSRPTCTQSPSSLKGPITRGMLKKIQIGFPQEDQNHHGLHMLFSWAKEYIKIW